MEDRSGPMLVLNIIFMTVTTIVVALRVYCRVWIVRSFGADDYLMVVTYVRCSRHWWPRLLRVRLTWITARIYRIPHLSAIRYLIRNRKKPRYVECQR